MKVIQARLKSVFDALSVTPNAFALTYKIQVPTIYGIINGLRNPNFDTLVHICEADSRISAEYLLRGEGEPLRSERSPRNLTTADELIAFKDEVNQLLDKRIAELSSV